MRLRERSSLMRVTKEDLLRGLEELGLEKGDYLVVHSSLKSFGYVVGGAATVVESLLQIVGHQGLMLMPTYATTKDANGDLSPLGPSSPIWTGAVPAAFASYPRACRGLHPLYSVTFAGESAEQHARNNEAMMFPYGEDQPYRVILRERGFILLIGVDDRSNSTIHMLEEMIDPPYLVEKKTQSHLTVKEFFARPIHERRQSLAHHRAGPKRDFLSVGSLLLQQNLLNQLRIGNTTLTLEPSLTLKQVFDQAMHSDANVLLMDKAAG